MSVTDSHPTIPAPDPSTVLVERDRRFRELDRAHARLRSRLERLDAAAARAWFARGVAELDADPDWAGARAVVVGPYDAEGHLRPAAVETADGRRVEPDLHAPGMGAFFTSGDVDPGWSDFAGPDGDGPAERIDLDAARAAFDAEDAHRARWGRLSPAEVRAITDAIAATDPAELDADFADHDDDPSSDKTVVLQIDDVGDMLAESGEKSSPRLVSPMSGYDRYVRTSDPDTDTVTFRAVDLFDLVPPAGSGIVGADRVRYIARALAAHARD